MTDIRESVKQAYGAAIERRAKQAGSGAGCCDGEVDVTDMTRGNYDAQAATTASPDVVEQSFGCGNPVQAALLKEGERVLDLGSGAGVDLILAAKAVTQSGHVYGLDMTGAMLNRARKNVDRLGLRNVTLLRGYIEEMPLHDESVDVLISNCVINLSPDKDKVFSEAYRVLTPGGRFCVSDVVLLKPVPAKLKSNPAAWSGWVAGALPAEEYKAKLERAGFSKVNVAITKPHELNIQVVKDNIEDLTPEDLTAIEGISASALITALK